MTPPEAPDEDHGHSEEIPPSREEATDQALHHGFVDARFNLGEYFLALIFVLLIISFRVQPHPAPLPARQLLHSAGDERLYLLLAIADRRWSLGAPHRGDQLGGEVGFES